MRSEVWKVSDTPEGLPSWGITAKLLLPQSQMHKYLLADTAHTLALTSVGLPWSVHAVLITNHSHGTWTWVSMNACLTCIQLFEQARRRHSTPLDSTTHNTNTAVVTVHNLRTEVSWSEKAKLTTPAQGQWVLNQARGSKAYCCPALLLFSSPSPSAERFVSFCLAAELSHSSSTNVRLI